MPLQYDSLLALVGLTRKAHEDPLCVCIPLFAHAAFSEVQFLNLIESRIQSQIDLIVEGLPTDALGTLQYFSNILNRHSQQLKDSTRALSKLAERNRQRLNQIQVDSPLERLQKGADQQGLSRGGRSQCSETEPVRNRVSSTPNNAFTSEDLLEDYHHLQVRCMDLSKLCAHGIDLAMNKATIDESRKAIEQSERVKKLTVLATFFIPLSFSSGLLSMNIDLLENKVQAWWFLVICVPMTLFAYMVYLWDFQSLMAYWVMVWDWVCSIDIKNRRGKRVSTDIV